MSKFKLTPEQVRERLVELRVRLAELQGVVQNTSTRREIAGTKVAITILAGHLANTKRTEDPAFGRHTL